MLAPTGAVQVILDLQGCHTGVWQVMVKIAEGDNSKAVARCLHREIGLKVGPPHKRTWRGQGSREKQGMFPQQTEAVSRIFGTNEWRYPNRDAHLIDQRPAGPLSTPLRHKLHLFGAFLQVELGTLTSAAVEQ